MVASLALLFFTALVIGCGGDGDTSAAGEPAVETPTAADQATVAADPSSLGTCGPVGSAISEIARTGQQRFGSPPERVIDPTKNYTAVLTTEKGDIAIELAAGDAPNTVNNFVFLSCVGYYDGLTFHRFVPDFVIQGGDPRGDGTGNPGYAFADEFSPQLTHRDAGVLSMANSGPNTNGSQFFITLAPTPHLDGLHSVFGLVIGGMDVVRQIRGGDLILSVSVEEE